MCGLAVVMRLENQPGKRRLAVGALCAAMALLFLLALAIPLLRDFYELTPPTAQAALAWGIGVTLGIGGMHALLRLLRI